VTNFYGLKTTTSDSCEVSNAIDVVRGSFDVNATDDKGVLAGYVVGVKLASALDSGVNQPSAENLRVPSNTAQITKVTAKYTWRSEEKAATTLSLADRTFPVSAIVPPGGNATFPVQIFSNLDSTALKKAKSGILSVELTFFGTLADGSDISSTPATFAIAVCADCIQNTCKVTQEERFPCGAAAAGQPDGRVCVDVAQ
jgi:hypothetical protein